MYLVEAGIVAPEQVDIALKEQQQTDRRLGEILVSHGWVKQQTIEYLMEKVVVPERDRFARQGFAQTTTSDFKPTDGKLPNEPELENLTTSSREFEFRLSANKTFQFFLVVIISLIAISLFGSFSQHFLPNYPSLFSSTPWCRT